MPQSKYILDVDGTLTPSRRPISQAFATWFSKFCYDNDVYLVTGSDRGKTIEQVGEYIYYGCKRVWQCNGNDAWCGDDNLYTFDIPYDADLEDAMAVRLSLSKFPIRTGLHVERRPGMINFSIVGRNATLDERMSYVEWDQKYDERDEIAHNLSLNFPKYNFQVAGETGIDITLKGRGKEQVLTDFEDSDILIFIGDKTELGGNDHGIAEAVNARVNGKSYNVSSWEDTWQILKENESA